MELSSYLFKNEKKWNDAEAANIHKLLSYLEKHVNVDLCGMAKPDDELEIFRRLEGWLFNFYPNEFRDGLARIGYSYHEYQKKLIYNLILAVTRNRPNVNILCDMLTSRGVIDGMFGSGEDEYKIVTTDFGEICFGKAEKAIDHELEEYLETLGERVVDGCHEVSFFLIKKDLGLRAVTGICIKGLGCKYYHSFVIDEGANVIDLTANLIMPKEQYYLLNDVQELNVVNYDEYLREESASKELDESKTLYDLLRNALYRQSLAEKTD